MSIRVENNNLVFEEVAEPLLQELPQEKNPSLRSSSMEDFIALLASKLPAPGGGGAAAMSAAQGFALASMVCNLTIGKKKFAPYEARLIEIQQDCSKKANRMLTLIDLDEEYFLPLSKAYGLPSDTEEEKNQKHTIMQEALVTACLVPLEILKTSYEAFAMLQELKGISSKLVVSDVGVAAESFRSAIESAKLNVLINMKTMEESPLKEQLSHHLKESGKYPAQYTEIMDYVVQSITIG